MSMMPAFSPGPCTTSLLRVGSRFKCTRDDLYEQCSLHITLKMPSSVSDGSRPSEALIRSYSSGVMPCSAMTSGVMAEACVIVDIVAISILAFSNIHHLADIQSHVAQAPRLRLPEHSIPLWHRHPRLCSPVLKLVSDHPIARSPDLISGALRAPTLPVHPRSSQFGVGFSDLRMIGVGYLSPLPPLPPMLTQFDPRSPNLTQCGERRQRVPPCKNRPPQQ